MDGVDRGTFRGSHETVQPVLPVMTRLPEVQRAPRPCDTRLTPSTPSAGRVLGIIHLGQVTPDEPYLKFPQRRHE